MLLLAAGAAGVLVAGLAVPAIAGLGLTARQGVVTFENLPADLKVPPLPQRSVIEADDGSFITSVYSENRVSVTSAQIPDVMRKSIVAIEDSRFYSHHGVDARGILRALAKNQQSGRIEQGASTLTQQYVKNVLLQSASTQAKQHAATADTTARKLQEARYAIALEQHLSKTEILTRYLNIALFGPGVYGVGTAATSYFGKSVKKLTLPEAATLAGLVQNPNRYAPLQHPSVTKERRNTVLARMAQTGAITKKQATAAEKAPLGLHPHKTSNGCLKARISAQFCSYVVQYLLNDPDFGATPAARQARLYKGGLTIRTSMDPKLEHESQLATGKTFQPNSTWAGVQAVVEPGTGYLRAIASSRPFTQDQNIYAARGFQTGSTAKAFVLVAALQKGLPLDTTINSPHDYTSPYFTNGGAPYSVSNDAAGMFGNYNMESGFAASVNTFFVQLEERAGVKNSVRAAEAMGARSSQFAGYLKGGPHDNGAFALGVASITPIDMADAYATIAAKGVQCDPTPIVSITDADGNKINAGAKKCHRAIAPGVAAAAAEAMTWPVNPKGHVTNGATATGAAVSGHTIAGKTGTTQELHDAWFVGFSGQLAVASLVTDPKNQVALPNGDGSNQLSVAAFQQFMAAALANRPDITFPTPPDKLVYGGEQPAPPPADHSVPSVVGQSVGSATSQIASAGLSYTIQHVTSSTPAGTVVSTSPGGGSAVYAGTVVTVVVSDGGGNGGNGGGGNGGGGNGGGGRTSPSPSPTCHPARACHTQAPNIGGG